MAASNVPNANREKILEYEKRVTERLQPDLEKALEVRKGLKEERRDYQDLASNVQRLLTEVGRPPDPAISNNCGSSWQEHALPNSIPTP